MSTYVYAYWEIFSESRWRFCGNYITDEEYEADLVPENAAPSSWGNFNFQKYYEVSEEKGLPDDLSKELNLFIAKHWDYLNRPSWMTLKEIIQFYEDDKKGRYAHINFESILEQHRLPQSNIRLIFWADQ